MNASAFCDLVAGMDSGYLCQYLNIHPRTFRRWKNGTAAVPETTVRLLRLRLYGDVSALMGDGWKGFYFGRDGLLYLPGWKYGWKPEEISALFFTRQELRAAKADLIDTRKANASLAADLAKLRDLVWAEKKLRKLVALEEVTRRG